ncbi:MAG: zinc ribbon domain-containing protein [Candidatus Coatesbacteria bacterium]|nr:MAG: zinc ribbon domain-containing protein [Candidatus Coatesbacteria bacterium]
MPTYEYKCNVCSNHFEKFESITSKPRAKCPVCGGAAKRLISGGAGLIFKGSGFYATDYRPSSYKKEAEKDKAAGEPASVTGEPASVTGEPASVTGEQVKNGSETAKNAKKGKKSGESG